MRGRLERLQAPLGLYPNEKPSNSEVLLLGEVINALLTTDPPVQLKEFRLTCRYWGDYSLLWNNIVARMTSLTHLSLPDLQLSECPPSLIFAFQELQYLRIHVAFAPRFANQPLKELRIDTECERGGAMMEVRRHWQGTVTVFSHVEYLKADILYEELNEIPIEFWREFLLKVNKVR